MSRLTKNISDKQTYCGYEIKKCKYQQIYDFKKYDELEDYVDCDLTLAIDKLDKLEDIEEELGCPLEVLVKILLYPKIRTRFGIREIDKIDYYVEDDNRGLMIYFKNGTFDKVSNYKKTWWLSETKEE